MVKASLGFEFSHMGPREDFLPFVCLGFPIFKVGMMKHLPHRAHVGMTLDDPGEEHGTAGPGHAPGGRVAAGPPEVSRGHAGL